MSEHGGWLRKVFCFGALGLAVALAAGDARAACPAAPYTANCWYPCGGSTGGPIRILYLGHTGLGSSAWLTNALQATGFATSEDCNGCPLVMTTDFVVTQASWSTARTWTTERFRAFDVIVTSSQSGSNYTSASTPDPWTPIYRGARRAVLTSLHIDSTSHNLVMNGFAEFLQSAVTWLSEDECCELSPGLGIIPAILVANDMSMNALQYTPWPGVIRSFSHGSGSDFGCTDSAQFDDTVIVDASHPLFTSINDGACGTCGENAACSLDNSDQSVHALWEQDHDPCGYEDDGFVAIHRVERASPTLIGLCKSEPPATCPAFSTAATTVTLVRDLPCCGLVEPRPVPVASCP